MIFVGIDWSETHHDACIVDVDGRVLAKGRVSEGVDGVTKLHEMAAAHAEDPSQVVVGIELDRGFWSVLSSERGTPSMPSTRSRSTDTGTATGPRGRSRIQVTPRS